MKNLLRRYIYSSARNSSVYRRLWHPLTRLTALAYREHYRQGLGHSTDLHALLAKICPGGLIVANGPFKGMEYPSAEAAGSSFFPKLLGSYEQELRGVIEAAVGTPYTEVIDIGCAEGYYAVGFAMKLPAAKVWAFDTNPNAASLCRRMAEANGVDGRVRIEGFCSAERMAEIAGTGRALIISDCEGFEEHLFTPATCQALRNSDLLIEIHDFIKPTISRTLFDRVSKTHDVERIRSIADPARPQVFCYPELDGEEDAARIDLMAELRPLQMEWFVCRSRG